MPKQLTVENVEEYFHGATECWRVTYLREDGFKHMHVFPKDTLEWRAAEYNIDPADVDTLLDIVLHEPFVDPQDTAVRAAGKLSLAVANNKTTRRGQLEPTNLFNAVSLGEARVAHLLRIEDVKENRINIRLPKGDDPLDEIRTKHQARPETWMEKKKMIAEGRRLLREGTPTTETVDPSKIKVVK